MLNRTKYIIITITVVLLLLLWLFYYLLYVKNASKINASDANILFVGSSTTAATNSYADKIKLHYPAATITKVAEVAAVTQWMKDNSIPEMQTGNYNVLCLLGGLNDIYATGSIEAAKTNITDIINTANDYNLITVLITLQPTDYYGAYTDNKGQLTNDLNQWILNDSKADIKIDLHSYLINSNGTQNTNLFQMDNLHLSDEAQNILAQQIENNLFL